MPSGKVVFPVLLRVWSFFPVEAGEVLGQRGGRGGRRAGSAPGLRRRVRSHLEKYSGADSARHGAARARGSAGRRGESDRAVTHRRGDVRASSRN